MYNKLRQTSHSLNIIYRIRKTQAHSFVFDVDSSNDSQCSYTANSKYTRHGMYYYRLRLHITNYLFFVPSFNFMKTKKKTVCTFM